MKLQKGTVWLFSFSAFVVAMIYSLVAGSAEGMRAAMDAILILAGIGMGAGVVDNGVKGKFYQPGLVKKAECPPEETSAP